MPDIFRTYFAACNAHDTAQMLECFTEDTAHFVNHGNVRNGKAAFKSLYAHMDRSCDEPLGDIMEFETDGDVRAAAECNAEGANLRLDGELPQARVQTHELPAGTFFDFVNGKIARVNTSYYVSDRLRHIDNPDHA